MATPILKIPVDDSAFQRFQRVFTKYQDALKHQPTVWGEIGDAMASAKDIGNGFVDSIKEQLGLTLRLAEEESKRDVALQESAKHRKREEEEEAKRSDRALDRMKRMVDVSRDYSRSLVNAAESVAKWTVGGAGLGLAGAVLGGFGLDSLVGGVAGQRRSAMGMGVTMGQQQGMNTYMGRFFDANSALENVSNAQADPAKWGYFRMMGVNPNGGTADVTYQAAAAARRMFKADHGNLMRANAQGLTQFFSPDELRRMAAASDSEFNGQMRGGRGMAGPSDETGRKWQNFLQTVDKAKYNIETAFVTGLGKIEGPLETMATTLGKWAANAINHLDWDALGKGFSAFAAWFTDGGAARFGTDVMALAGKMDWALKKLGWVPDYNPNDADDQTRALIGMGFGLNRPARPGEETGNRGFDQYWSPQDIRNFYTQSGDVDMSKVGTSSWKGGAGGGDRTPGAVMKYFMGKGVSQDVASGLTAGVVAEAGLSSRTGGGYHHRAIGIGQLLGDRRTQFLKQYGSNFSFQNELDFMWKELNDGKHGNVLGKHTSREALKEMILRFYVPKKGHETISDLSRGSGFLQSLENNMSARARPKTTHVKVHVKNSTGSSVAVSTNSAAGR